MTKDATRTLDPEAFSRPERAVHNKQARALLERVKACGGCYCCLRRDQRSEGWGRATCGKVPPAKFLQEGCTFEPDHERIHEGEPKP